MHKSVYCLAVVLGLISVEAFAKGTYVLSINGVNTDPLKAESNKDRIEELIVIPNKNSIESGPTLVVDFVHNQSSGLGADLVDVWLQTSSEQALRLSEGYFSVGPLPQALGDAIRRRAELAQQIDERAWGSDADLRDMIDRSSTRMKAGDRVFLMPHSQGNLYANRVYDGIFERPGIPDLWKESVGISGIASAASYVAGPFSRYVTSSTDVVIGALNAIRGTLPANVTLPISSADFTGHGLQEIYLANSASKTIISANAVFLGQNVKYPGTLIADLSAAASDSAALADLIDDANSLSPTLVEPGKPLYLEGSGLAGAQYEIPGVSGRISATAVNLPTDHPLYVADAEVWKLAIPANAMVGASGVIRAIIAVDGVDQSFESPRSVQVQEPQAAALYTRFVQGASGLPRNADGSVVTVGSCPRMTPGFGFQESQVYHTYWVDILEIRSGPDAGSTYKIRTLIDCNFGGGASMSVLNIGVPRRENPGLGQATIKLSYSYDDGLSDYWVESGNITYREYTPRLDAGGNCDVRSFTSRVYATFAAGSDPVIRPGWDGTVTELSPSQSSCSDALIMGMKRPENLVMN